MRKTILPSIFLLLASFMVQSSAFALERWYRIELIILEHKDKSGVLLEEWPLDPGYPKVNQAFYLKSYSDDGGEVADNLVELPEEALELRDAKKSLTQRTGSKILLHTAWKQKVVEGQPVPIRFTGGKEFDYVPAGKQQGFKLSEFDGTLTVLLSRYLHVQTDLVFHKPMELVAKASSYAHDMMQRVKPLANESNWQQMKGATLQRFRINEKRKIKKDEVFYIDHPLYGIMIKISDDKQLS